MFLWVDPPTLHHFLIHGCCRSPAKQRPGTTEERWRTKSTTCLRRHPAAWAESGFIPPEFSSWNLWRLMGDKPFGHDARSSRAIRVHERKDLSGQWCGTCHPRWWQMEHFCHHFIKTEYLILLLCRRRDGNKRPWWWMWAGLREHPLLPWQQCKTSAETTWFQCKNQDHRKILIIIAALSYVELIQNLWCCLDLVSTEMLFYSLFQTFFPLSIKSTWTNMLIYTTQLA